MIASNNEEGNSMRSVTIKIDNLTDPQVEAINTMLATWVDSHGGEAYVSEMLTKGRVFRFKWGGE